MDHATFPLDIKKLSDIGQIEGLAAGYGNVDAHGETFAAGAFTKSLASGRAVAMLLHHDMHRPAGKWTELRETRGGLLAFGTLALDSSDGREAYALLKAGALAGLSVGFRAIKSSAGPGGGALITEAELYEVSLVAVPSNPLTKVSGVKGVGDVREIEALLRDAGMSGRRAKIAASAAWRAAQGSVQDVEMEARSAALLRDASKTIANIFGS